MKNKYIVFVLIILILIIGVIYYLISDDGIVSRITLDINPSIELGLDSKERVVSYKALNDDAKDIVDSSLKGKKLDVVFDSIVQSLVEEDYANSQDLLNVIVYSKGDISNTVVRAKLSQTFTENNINTNVIVIENITKEDEKLSKKYNITPAKASYINSIVKDSEEVDAENFIDKSADELNETKNSGKYCESGYTLEGDFCLKEVSSYKATGADVCPHDYLDYNGTCYLEEPFIETDKLVCRDEFTLESNKCVRKFIEDATPEYSCSKGELLRKGDVNPIGSSDNDKMYCVDKSTGKPPVLRCLYNSGHIMINGKCYNGPAPLINGGCPNGDLPIGGWCYSKDDEDQWQCPNGNIYSKKQGTVPELCPDTLTYINPTITGYTCNDDFTLEDKKCVKVESEDAEHERICPTGFTMVEHDRCVDLSKTANKEDGLICEKPNSRIKGNTCFQYEMIDAKEY